MDVKPEGSGSVPQGDERAPGRSRPDADQRPPADEAAGPARPRTKAGQREATVTALCDAARALFAERGFAAVGTEEIVQRAGVTRGALYHHFRGGKEELFHTVLVQITAETARRVAAAAQAEQDAWEALIVGADEVLDACAIPDVARIVLIEGPAVLGWDVWRAIDSEYGLGLVERALERAMDAGSLVRQPTAPLAQVLLGAVHEAAMVVAQADDREEARAEMRGTVRRLLEGLRTTIAPEG
jgi:AcrR family transcriptional regulator